MCLQIVTSILLDETKRVVEQRKMKVLMLGWELPPHNSGGLGVACWQLCKALSQKGIDIEFVLPYQADHDVEFMEIKSSLANVKLIYGQYLDSYDSASFTEYGMAVPAHEQTTHANYEETVAKLCESSNFDIIHAHDWLTFRAGLRAREISGKPLLVHVHSIESDRAGGNNGNPLVREIEGLTFMLADKILAVSNHTKQGISREYGIPLSKIEVVHNSYDECETIPVGDKTAYTYLEIMKRQGYKIVVNVGRLTIQKNIPNLLRAAQEVIKREPKTLFLIVGTGEQDYELLELAASLGISKNVIFTGFLRGKQLRDAFAIGDLFVMPSVSEPFGLTPLEAASYGTASLISKQSGVSEVFNNCLKVDFWDVSEMANVVVSAVQNPSMTTLMAKNAQDELMNLSWNDSADKIKTIYHEHHSGALL